MRRFVAVPALALAFVLVVPSSAGARPGDPEPGSPEWQARDEENVNDSMGRWEDEHTNPAFQVKLRSVAHETWLAGVTRFAENPTRPRLTPAWVIPGGDAGDPFRAIADWHGVRGQVEELHFTNRNGARLRGHVWAPLPGRFRAPYPAVVVTTGSIQAPEAAYYWVAQGLAEAGYLVMTYDVQGQGHSETFGHQPDGSVWCGDPEPYASPPEQEAAPEQGDCPGVPSQQDANFVRGTTDALDLLFSTPSKPYRWLGEFLPSSEGTVGFNPYWKLLDRRRVGLAGHSLGASAISEVQQWDRRVRAIVAFDNLSAVERPRVPALGLNGEYFLNPEPSDAPPDPDAKRGAFEEWRAAGVDAMQVALRGSTHLEWSFIPDLLPASRLGERVSMHYTLAWFDRYLRGRRAATRRLVATTFDASADASAIGTGAYEPPLGNVPHLIEGIPVWERLSFYYRSSYWLERGRLRCEDVREGCRAAGG